MSAATILLGLAAFAVYGRLHDAIGRVAVGPLSANWYYDGAVSGLNGLGERVSGVTQTGLLRTYAYWTLGATSTLVLAGFLAARATLPAIPGVAISAAAVVVLLVAVLAAAAVVGAPSHVAGVLTLSILGFVVAIFYVLAAAPDLALTQLVVETLVLVIFLLVLDRLPAYYGEAMSARAIRDAGLALLVGVTVTLTVLLATAAQPGDGIASYFVENALDPGGGGNVVNVILVDFRAFDTMGEISVIAMAALSVLTLIAMRGRGETQR
jgi:multicomponent Na+:H+ antiporter subunit A